MPNTVTRSNIRKLSILDIGRSAYREATEMQLDLLQERRNGHIPDTLILTEHDPVVTAGSATEPDETPDPDVLAANGIAFHKTSRGGRLTYHGPGQLVAYPIMDLRLHGRDLHAYLADLQTVVIAALNALGVCARARQDARGAWVRGRKIASIGIAVRRWISYHGFAMNVDCDLSPFRLIAPCGMPDLELTTIAAETGRIPDRAKVRRSVIESFAAVFAVQAAEAVPD